MTEARTRGERVAKLGGIKLGRVLAVEDLHVAGHSSRRRGPVYWFMDQSGEAESDPDEMEVDKLTEVPLNVQLLVRFEIAGPAETPPASSADKTADAKVSKQ